ncbi:MAG: SoxR reducing system RseC family protein [Desulfobacterales bacterium]|nr:SoxR reducing system RseC family protein [Desulfobacterales bacterium]
MSNNAAAITHPGIIEEIGEDHISVKILSQSACASCHAKGACTMADMEEKTIRVSATDSQEWKPGQNVDVQMKKSLGPKAVLMGYVYPFLIVVIGLVLFSGILPSEGMAGLASLALLIPYYGFIYLIREKLQKTFTFEIKPRMMFHPSE